MQALQAFPLDLALCQTATASMWEEYVELWTEQKARADREKERERLRLEAEAEELRLTAEAKAKEEKAIADAMKAREDAEKAEREALLDAERAENAKLKATIARIEAENLAKAQAVADADLAVRIKAETEAVEKRKDLERIAMEQSRSDLIAREKAQAELDRPDIDRLNDWRIEVRAAVEAVTSPTFTSESVQEAFGHEFRALHAAIPEIYPFL